ncbi:hypothetical protein DCAR_0415491 [Daucus carota subsp. sativus]|uniref:Uncharacterized protein n=1 Tax=Daucus carota subsp. sativus TaxID=79200 RepID=A0A165WB54_DAUCS|nr:hypothetical protein DCAR_0415491 [Daucus carota subsp. sativus]
MGFCIVDALRSCLLIAMHHLEHPHRESGRCFSLLEKSKNVAHLKQAQGQEITRNTTKG